jgi:hypothetical protein
MVRVRRDADFENDRAQCLVPSSKAPTAIGKCGKFRIDGRQLPQDGVTIRQRGDWWHRAQRPDE